MCASGILFAIVALAEVWAAGGSRAGCPSIVQRSQHFAKVHNDTCYLFVNQERYWSEARQACWDMGGEMLSVQDYHVMTFIRSTLNSPRLGWKKQGVWLGAKYSGGKWRWTTGKQIGYANWASGEPSKILGLFSVEDCALMRRKDNWRWHDYICGSMKYHFNYICQFPVENVAATPTTTATTSTTASTTSSATARHSFKPDYPRKKGRFSGGHRPSSRPGSHRTNHKENKMDTGEEGYMPEYGQNDAPVYPYESHNGQNDAPVYPYESHNGQSDAPVYPYRPGQSNAPIYPHNVQNRVPGHRYESHPGFNERGYNEYHTPTHAQDNGNLTILTIILVSGGIVLMILVLIFLIMRKRYNYKKAMAQPTVHFENRNYNHTHSGSGVSQALPPPAPHTFHPPSAPPVPPRPMETLTSHSTPVRRTFPHLAASFVPDSRPSSDLYLTPVDMGEGVEGVYEEVQAPNTLYATIRRNPLDSAQDNTLGAIGGGSELDGQDSATVPLISGASALWGQSEESLHSMSGSLTQKTSNIHNDYVDMNGSPVVIARCQNKPELPKLPDLPSTSRKGETSDPKDELSVNEVNGVTQGEGKQPVTPYYGNLMTTSQERCENLYAQLR